MASIEDFVPGAAELRARERENRARAFSGITRTVCGEELRALTPRARLELQLLRNAFVNPPAEPLDGDVFVFLWITNARRATSLPGRALNPARQFLLRRRVKRLALDPAIREIRIHLAEQLQDAPGITSGNDGTDYSRWIHWMAQESGFWLNVHGGFSFEEYLATPYLVLQQLRRVWQINHPEIEFDSHGKPSAIEPTFRNNSDRLVGRWQAENRVAIGRAIRARRGTRL